MNLTGIIAVSGKSGLYKLLARTKSGFVLESLDERKTKLVASLNIQKFTSLEETTIFSITDEEIKLGDVFKSISDQESVPSTKTDNTTLRQFFRNVAPSHDDEQVYISDIKKIITWYNILKDMPLFTEVIDNSNSEEEVISEISQ